MHRSILNKLKPYILLIPFSLLSLILLISLVNVIIQSLGYIPALGLTEISLKYYLQIIKDSAFLDSLLFSLFTCMISSLLSVIVGVLICTSFVYSRENNSITKNIISLPIIIPHSVVALLMILLLSQSGIVSRIFYVFGNINVPAEFPNLIFNKYGAGIIIAYVWKQAPFVSFFVLSLMASISRTFEEAAINLGASPIKAFFNITLPLSMPSIIQAFFIIMAFSFGAYELPFLLGMTLPKALPVQTYIEYNHPDLKHRPYAMAMNGIIILILLIISILYFWITNKKVKSINNE